MRRSVCFRILHISQSRAEGSKWVLVVKSGKWWVCRFSRNVSFIKDNKVLNRSFKVLFRLLAGLTSTVSSPYTNVYVGGLIWAIWKGLKSRYTNVSLCMNGYYICIGEKSGVHKCVRINL